MIPHGVIIGAGLAGAATAYFLAKSQRVRVTLLEREGQAGIHASGKNAAMARQFVLDPTILPHALRGTAFLYHPDPAVAETPLIRPVGSIIFFHDSQSGRILESLATGQKAGLMSMLILPSECHSRVPILTEMAYHRAIWTPTDGVVDVDALLRGFISGALSHGAEYRLNARVEQILWHTNGVTIETARDTVRADFVVNAAGAWADQIATYAGVSPQTLQPMRRHLLMTVPSSLIDPQWPFVWDDAAGWYFRPESGGLLCSPCDETPVTPDDTSIDPEMSSCLAEKLLPVAAPLAELQIARCWSGLRTFTPQRRLCVQWDPHHPAFYWVAGLGGHGVTCAASVGETAAAEILQRHV
ncbi:MAG: FAD-binding oxidoreductase [Deltaproteobacteria bacterium]|nr:FAD-binding oxidoreductase [Deltaproteobacteria bacterium]